jgi:lipoprotein Spr
MKKRLLPLIAVLFLTTTVANAAHTHKNHHARARHSKHKRAHKEYIAEVYHPVTLNTDGVSADSVLTFAQTLLGTPYRAASSNPNYGFDCSGFVSYVFKSFGVNVQRSSSDFANVGERISLEDARPGDIILFKGTKTHHPHSIGHAGIVYATNDGISFIHSTSGKEHGVTISQMDDTYKRRFVMVVRVLKQNDDVVLASR